MSVHINPNTQDWLPQPLQSTSSSQSKIHAFHRSLPNYTPTPLLSLPTLATRLGVSHVLLKDESSRLGLPSFKIVGVAWAVYRALHAHLGLDGEERKDVTMEELGRAVRRGRTSEYDKGDEGSGPITLTCATEGNCGRALARMAKTLGIRARVYVPGFVDASTKDLIASEGADVRVVDGGDYDQAILAAEAFAKEDPDRRLLVMDHAWEGYEVVPQWVTQGYSTILTELDAQLPLITRKPLTHAIVSVGVGSWAHAVTTHYKQTLSPPPSKPVHIITAEPTTATSLQTSLKRGAITPLKTPRHSIMAGMNCGTVSTLAWPVLARGVTAAVSVGEEEAHRAVLELGETAALDVAVEGGRRGGIEAGPCGAATWAALRRCCGDALEGSSDEGETTGRGDALAIRRELGLDADAVVVLFCSEGKREYEVPAGS